MTSNTSIRLAGIAFAAALMALGWVPVVSAPAPSGGAALFTLA